MLLGGTLVMLGMGLYHDAIAPAILFPRESVEWKHYDAPRLPPLVQQSSSNPLEDRRGL